MQSHLTRRVFRAILDSEPLCFSQCHRNRLLHTISPARVRPSFPSLHHVSRRSLFAFNITPTNEGKPSTLPSEKGLKPMADLMRSLADKSRAPPNHTLAKAFQVFFSTRVETPSVINGFQARLLIVTWKHLKAEQNEMDEVDWYNVFSTENLEKMLYVLSESQCLPASRDAIQKIARFAFLELCADHGFGPNKIGRQALLLYINLLSMNGNPEEARHVVLKFWSQLRKVKPSPWLTVLKGFALKDDRRQLRKITEEFETHGNKFDQASHEELLKILLEQNLFAAAQTVYEFPISENSQPSVAAKEAMIKSAVLKSELDWAKPIVASLPQDSTAKTLDISLLWEAAQGNNASALAEKTDSWIVAHPNFKEQLSIATVNNLLQYANAIENPQLVADFAKLADRWDLKPNSQTYLLQLESYVQAGDVEQTLDILEERIDPNTLPSENLPLANKLVTMLCLSKQKDTLFQHISSLLDPLFEENVRLYPETIAALTRMLLYRHDWEAVSELLRPRLSTYDDEGKTQIRNALADFILDLTQSDSDVWGMYNLLKVAFPETGVSVRTEIMATFFKRKRSDLGVLVFGHMRQAEDLSRRPKPDTYARCFQGLARTHDESNLELVHNMLKLDLEVDLNTRVLNSLMLAYAACDMPEKSMTVFRQILQSDEGPSHKTIAIFFRACEKYHNGAQEAMKMMAKVKKLEIPVDRQLYTAYIEAMAAQCEFELATEAIDQMQAEIGAAPTRTTIGLFYNAIPYQYWKDQVEEWASKQYPVLWAQLAETRRSEHEEGQKFDGIVNDVWI
ncbi:hypothetical protein NUU61_003719 [Penicillium alfredii]|uniref:Pentacotripeptide-repeat region of PRORP domain-containing protein n=1 Tax=Penicillium alfredii TaxID=1506179 RepID=A0A9W9FKB4_9EURO|nr:uncharacterized protein NUU61_003719 [Penicillium alfredii]KAJ5101497.1 hypothetical protein NUU61_003719 [Penicillium alfredii]